jgi:hypothetical protein
MTQFGLGSYGALVTRYKMAAVWKKKIKKKYFNKNVNSTCVRGVEIKVALYNSAIVRAIHCQISGATLRHSE